MTVQDVTSLVAHTGNGATTLWPYDFIIPDSDYARVGLFDIPTGVLVPLDINDYNITGIGNANGGDVTYPLSGSPIPATKRVVIWREVPYTQDTDLTDQMPYYPTVLEGQLDRIVMQVQQLKEESERTFKVTPGSTATPDELIEQLFDVAVQAEAAAGVATTQAGIATTKAGEAAASAIAAGNLLATAVQIVPQSFTAAQKGQARANIDADVLGGFRNKVINPNWQVAQRATSGLIAAASIGYVGDRWLLLNGTEQSLTWNFADARDRLFNLPRHVDRYLYFNFSAPPTTGSIELLQRIENVRSVPEGKATWRMYAAAPTPVNCLMYLGQNFGSGGSSSLFPSEIGVISTTSDFTELNAVFDVPSTADKTFGTNDFALFEIALSPRSIGPYSFACASLVIGDASAEDDPSTPRHIQQELALCQRYYQKIEFPSTLMEGNASSAGVFVSNFTALPVQMRGTPTVVEEWDTGTEANLLSKSMIGRSSSLTLQLRADAVGRFYATPVAARLDAEI